MTEGIVHGPVGPATRHICVDMQRMFAQGSWKIQWMAAVLPRIARICERHAPATIFTRFIPPDSPADAQGTWRDYYERWPEKTRGRLDPGQLELVEVLAAFAPPARLFDKAVYSPWLDGRLDLWLTTAGADCVVITGGETDMCVLSTVLGAVDRGLRVILVSDAVCSSIDKTHDAIMALYRTRFGVQIETLTTEALLDLWPRTPDLAAP